MQLFFSTRYDDHLLYLTDSEAEHCTRVLRHQVGDEIAVINGMGDFFRVEIRQITKGNVQTRIMERISDWNVPFYETHLIFPYLKSRETVEWAIEKAVELGVTHLYFTPTARSERSILKPERVTKILVATVKQCLRGKLPEVSFCKDWQEAIAKTEGLRNKYLAYCLENQIKFVPEIFSDEAIVIAIGPEGDFTEREVDQARAAGFQVVSLGKERLRSETAIIYTLSLIKGRR
jgi:16S rRNA (uracil1498-N3)-methyltransferase